MLLVLSDIEVAQSLQKAKKQVKRSKPPLDHWIVDEIRTSFFFDNFNSIFYTAFVQAWMNCWGFVFMILKLVSQKLLKINQSKELVYGDKFTLQYQVVAWLRLDHCPKFWHNDYDLNFISSLGYIKTIFTIGFSIIWKFRTVIQTEPRYSLVLESKLATLDQLLSLKKLN